MYEDKVNVYINSKNRATSETVSNFNIAIPDGLLRLYDKNEYWTLNVNFFSCFNNWYNCMTDFNDKFQLIYHNSSGVQTEVLTFQLKEGNPDVYDVKTNLNTLLSGHVTVGYDKPRNVFMYTRSSLITTNRTKLYLNIINAEDFLGFPISKRYLLIELPLAVGVYSEQPVNVVGDEAITITINGDADLEGNTVDNFGSKDFVPSDIIFCQAIDVPPYALIQYNNEDAGDSFQYRLKQIREIKNFSLIVKNQDNEVIPKMTDYLLTLQFVKHKSIDKTASLLEKILDYLKQIFMMIGLEMFPSQPQPQEININEAQRINENF
jgi:hypothetical protein